MATHDANEVLGNSIDHRCRWVSLDEKWVKTNLTPVKDTLRYAAFSGVFA